MNAVFTKRQRDVLKGRLSRALAWHRATHYERSVAEETAETVLRELEASFLSAAAQRRAVLKVIEASEEQTA